ncbi:polyketide cyclase [Rhodobacterales bacterium HKCCE2091]|nr:polyketide cyclase [Rhodobacterales bacterium HKCCE2091]
MTGGAEAARSVVIDREYPHAPDRIWRALTMPHLVAEWLMAGNVAATPGHRFAFTADWGRVDCEVREVEPGRRLVWSWDAGALRSTVTWTLEPTATGTRLRLEQTGFAEEAPRYYHGARAGWPRFLDALETLLDGDIT